MEMVTLQASPRAGTKAKALRRSSRIPCVLYGFGTENTALECDEVALQKAYVHAGESTVVELAFGIKKIPVLFHEVQLDPVTDRLAHVDFYALNMKKEVKAPVPIRLTGKAPAVEDLGAVLVLAVNHVTVQCLPKDLPHDLPIACETLKAFGDSLKLSAISLPQGVVVLEDPETVIALIQEPRQEEEIAPVAPVVGAVPVEGAAAAPEGEEAAESSKGEETTKEGGAEAKPSGGKKS